MYWAQESHHFKISIVEANFLSNPHVPSPQSLVRYFREENYFNNIFQRTFCSTMPCLFMRACTLSCLMEWSCAAFWQVREWNEPHFGVTLDDVYQRFHHLLEDLNLVWLDTSVFTTAVQDEGAPLDKCWGFIGGTACLVARPVKNQKVMYSGRKRFHCLKFQSVTTPNGLIGHMFGPIVGRRHDTFMLSVSGLQQKLANITKHDGSQCVIYGDPVYGVSSTIVAPYRVIQLTVQQEAFNRSMSRVRTSVEWAFGKIVTNFSYFVATHWKILPSGCTLDELSHMFVWIVNIHVFWFGLTITGDILIEYVICLYISSLFIQ